MSSRRDARRWRGPLTIGLVVATIGIAATVANVALLGSTGEDRLGRLSPVDRTLTQPVARPARTRSTATTPAAPRPATAAGPVSAPPAAESRDDDHGSSGNGRDDSPDGSDDDDRRTSGDDEDDDD